MFTFTTTKPDSSQKIIGLQESINDFLSVVNEANIDEATLISGYKKLMTETLASNDNVYNDDVKTVLTESSKDTTSSMVTTIENMIKSFHNISANIKETYSGLSKINKEVVQKYQPLLRQLNTTKCSYQVPSYNFDNLATSDMLSRLMDCINKDIGMNVYSKSADQDEIASSSSYCNTNRSDVSDSVKRAVLGVSPTINVANSFYKIARDLIVDPTIVNTYSFSESTFDELLNSDSIAQVTEIDAIIMMMTNELSEVKKLKENVLSVDSQDGSEYTNNQKVQFYVTRRLILANGLILISEIIRLRTKILEEKCSIYRKIVINTYEKLTGKTGSYGKLEETYDPANDKSIEFIHLECAIDNDIFS